jgi:hypothetical protein
VQKHRAGQPAGFFLPHNVGNSSPGVHLPGRDLGCDLEGRVNLSWPSTCWDRRGRFTLATGTINGDNYLGKDHDDGFLLISVLSELAS